MEIDIGGNLKARFYSSEKLAQKAENENNYEETKLEATLNTMCEQYSNTYSNIQIFFTDY